MTPHRTPFILCLLLLALEAPLVAATGTWSALGPDGGPVYSLASPPGSPQVIYAGVFGGAYKSVDGGVTWRWAGRGLELQSPVSTLVIDPSHPSTLYAGQTTGLFKSVNGGATWTQTGLPPFLAILDLAIHPRAPQTVFAATSAGLFQTNNGGGRWKRLTQGLPPRLVALAVVVDPKSPRRMFAAFQENPPEPGGLFKSLDGGFSWQRVHGNLPDDSFIDLLAIDPRSPRTLYASTPREGLFKSADDGDTWTRLTGPVTSLAFHPAQKNVLYAGNLGGVYRSLDGGATWTRLSQDLPEVIFVNSLLISPTRPSTLMVGVDYPAHQSGVFRSTDSGASWMRSNRGLTASNINSLAVEALGSNTLWVVGNYTLLKSADRGRTWRLILPEPLPILDAYARQVVASPVDPETIYLGRWNGQVLRSRDGGESWAVAGQPSSFTTVLKADPRDPLTLWATGDNGGIRKSTDGGDTWSTLTGPASGGFFQDLAFAPSSPSTVYAAGNPDFKVLLRSTDAGATWTAIQHALPPSLGNLAVDPLQAETVYTFSGGDLYRTVDGGSTWTLVNSPFQNHTVQWLTTGSSGVLYAAVRYDNVYESEDGGLTWSPLGDGPRPFSFTALAADPEDPCRVYAGTYDRGLLVFTKTGTATCP
jgi:photosystem II stability/assembly factor-like uncharacterized protein